MRDSFPEYIFREAEKNFAQTQNNLHVSLDEFVDLNQVVDRVESAYIKNAMLQTSGNISQAAQRLGIKRQTLQHKLKKYSLEH
ncbi:helix-turn-helix domain-containing protein [Anoxynatronum sibiricum]|uniref:Helix-turn-helix domain-containing protein n=2 Tax=Anoxynatronum sibiricum TaxID=210623 RepID=A0ABU9VSX4_9CLOT